MTGGKSPKRKGDAGEVEFCKLYGGQRTFWQPGKAKTPDIINLEYLGKGEIKRRARGFKTIYDWLASNDFLAMRADRKPWLVCMKMDDLKLILEEMDELKKGRV